MKKLLIASSVGAVILFVWSAMAWTMLPLHHHTFMYTPNQDPIMEAINQNLDESGVYAVPNVDNRDIKLFDPEYKKAYYKKNRPPDLGERRKCFFKQFFNHSPMAYVPLFTKTKRGSFISSLCTVAAARFRSLSAFT